MTSLTEHRVAPTLLECLMEVVRPEFRAEVFHPPLDNAVFFQGTCRVASCPTAVSFSAKGLCNRHYHRWRKHREEDFEHWLVEEDALTVVHLAVAACAVTGCNRAQKSHLLCSRHRAAWEAAGCPDVEGWPGGVRYKAPRTGGGLEKSCTAPRCERWTDGPTLLLCRNHHQSWCGRGRPDLDDWFAELAWGANPRVHLGRLARGARLEFQFGLQSRYDAGAKLTPIRALSAAVGRLEKAQVQSLLDLTEEEWRQHLDGAALRAFNSMARNFLLDTRFSLEALLVKDDPWSDQFPRDTWDLRLLGFPPGVRRLRFEPIVQPWLRDLVKRWCRWRLSQGLATSTVFSHLAGCVRLSRHLAVTGTISVPEELTRLHLEGWLAVLRVDEPEPTRAASISAVRVFLNDVRRHGWEPRLPAATLIFGDDHPRRKRSNPRWIAEHLMAQMEAPANLILMRSDQDRTLLQVLMQCGLRLGCARTLPFGSLVHDDTGAPYLAWLNRKMQDRPAFFPLAEPLAQAIVEQQGRVLQRFPTGCRWLFPAPTTNLDGAKAMSGSAYRTRLDRWLMDIHLADEHGRVARVTSHQFRHTVGTRLINADVPQHVVQQLLDHMSPEMTAIYARLHDATVRRHWERAVKINAEGRHVVLDEAHPLNDAAWMRLSMVRAKVTLPNGYCGAPIQTDCEFANPCLDCSFFITTRDFLDQHRRQRDETKTMVAHAEHTGLVRLVEKNTRTLRKLDTIIGALEASGPDEVVAGGKVTAVDAVG
jgi:site-specific recombinase XerD